MQFAEYSQAARSTRLATADHSYVVLNLIGEVGELYGKFAKAIRDGSKVEFMDIKKELGDCLWCLSAMCDDLGTDLEEVAILNIQKLSKRKENNTLTGSGDNR
jgi:NTP pyrophosphatase (non-canonical NTP hydrolase)